MSDFAERIRDARSTGRPAPDAAPHPQLAAVLPLDEGPTLEELEAQRRRLDALARKIDDLNASILHEILREPGGAIQYPRTVAALADELSERSL
jgi:hypothetical protein